MFGKTILFYLPAALFLSLSSGPADLRAADILPQEDQDSLTVVGTRWNTVRLKKGISLKQYHFTDHSLFGSNQSVSIVEIDLPRKNRHSGKTPRIDIVAREKLTPVGVIAREEKALVAINGSFFALNKPYNSVDYLRVDGRELAPNEYKDGTQRLRHQLGAIAVQNGRLSILKADTSAVWETTVEAEDLLTSGPLLRIHGQDEPLRNDSFYIQRHPRTAVGITEEGKIWLITIDGRNAQAQGMSLEELQKMFRWLGASDLLNLDGGGSTTLYIRPDLGGKKVSHEEGIVNYPTDNHKFDHRGVRSVANAVIVR